MSGEEGNRGLFKDATSEFGWRDMRNFSQNGF